MTTRPSDARILVFSQRNMVKALFRCAHYEFEDVISAIDSVDLVAPQANLATSRGRRAQRIGFHAPIFLNPGLPPQTIGNRYDVFFAICGAPQDLLVLNAARPLREACSASVCLIDELWVREMPSYRYYLRILKDFDYVLLYYSGTVKPLNDQIG